MAAGTLTDIFLFLFSPFFFSSSAGSRLRIVCRVVNFQCNPFATAMRHDNIYWLFSSGFGGRTRRCWNKNENETGKYWSLNVLNHFRAHMVRMGRGPFCCCWPLLTMFIYLQLSLASSCSVRFRVRLERRTCWCILLRISSNCNRPATIKCRWWRRCAFYFRFFFVLIIDRYFIHGIAPTYLRRCVLGIFRSQKPFTSQ